MIISGFGCFLLVDWSMNGTEFRFVSSSDNEYEYNPNEDRGNGGQEESRPTITPAPTIAQTSTCSDPNFPSGLFTEPCFQSRFELVRAVQYYTKYDGLVNYDEACRKKLFRQHGESINQWCLDNVTDFSNLFRYRMDFNDALDRWDVSHVESMQEMFYSARAFNQDISAWDVSAVSNMEQTFADARAFNQNISTWDVLSVVEMKRMFEGAVLFNQDISTWDVSGVRYMSGMYMSASKFNQDLSHWNMSNVTDIRVMFSHARNFSQDLCAWGNKLPLSAMTHYAFKDTNCPNTSDPDMHASPPGPFCFNCI